MLDRRSPVLEKLAELYSESAVGTTGEGARPFGVSFFKLLRTAHCTKGESLAVAEADLRAARLAGAIEIDEHRRSHDWQRIRVPLAREAALFALIGRTSPTAEREAWAALFEQAAQWPIPEVRQAKWQEFCRTRAQQSRAGLGWKPFRRGHRLRAEMHLRLCSQLLAWDRPCLLRTASAQLAGSSKVLETSAATLQTLLSLASGGEVRFFADVGIEHNPATVRFHGPVRVRLRGVTTDYAHYAGESALSEADLTQIEKIEIGAPRCITVENATKFHELCRLNSGDVFVFTSYPNHATVHFLRSLPTTVSLFHFGDTDPWGFDVLRSLRQTLQRPIAALHMQYRSKLSSPPLTGRDRRKLATLLNDPRLADVRFELERINDEGAKGDFEQESLALTLKTFPYAETTLK